MIRITVVLLAVTAVVRAQQEYCNEKLCDPGVQHTMCKFQTDDLASSCGKVDTELFLKDDEKQAIVKKHNDLRAEVTKGDGACLPPATNMQTLVWDDELATIARRWAVQCGNGHDPCRKRQNGEYVGQNLWWKQGGYVANDFINGIQTWYDEKKDFPPRYIAEFKQPLAMTGHYTQLVWANTAKVGCERIRFRGNEENLVCNYAPGGNVGGEPVYIIQDGVDTSSCTIAHGVLARGQVSHLVFALSLGLSAAGYLGLRLTF